MPEPPFQISSGYQNWNTVIVSNLDDPTGFTIVSALENGSGLGSFTVPTNGAPIYMHKVSESDDGAYEIVANKLTRHRGLSTSAQPIGADSEGLYYFVDPNSDYTYYNGDLYYSDGSGSQLVFDGLLNDSSYGNKYYHAMEASDVDGDGQMEICLLWFQLLTMSFLNKWLSK